MDKGKGRELEIPYRSLPLPYGFHDGGLPPLDPAIFDRFEDEVIETEDAETIEQRQMEQHIGSPDEHHEIHMPVPKRPVGIASMLTSLDQPQLFMPKLQFKSPESSEDFNIIDELIEEYYRQMGSQPLSTQALSIEDFLSSDPHDLSKEDYTGEQSRFIKPLDLGDFDFESRIAGIPWPPKVIHMERFGHKTGQALAVLSAHDRGLLRQYLDLHVPVREFLMAEEWRQWQKNRKFSMVVGTEAENPIVIEDGGGGERQQVWKNRMNPMTRGQELENSIVIDDKDGNERTSQVVGKGKKSQDASKEKKPPGAGKEKKPQSAGKQQKSQGVGKGKKSKVAVVKESVSQVIAKEGNSQVVEKSGYQYADGSSFSP